MQHPEIDTLVAYADEALLENERLELESHLAICPACTHEIELARQLNGLIEQVEVPQLPADFLVKLSAARPQPKVVELRRRPIFRVGLLAAAGLTVLVGGLHSYLSPSGLPAADPVVAIRTTDVSPSPRVTPTAVGKIVHPATPRPARTEDVALATPDLPLEMIRIAPGTDLRLVARHGTKVEFELRHGRVWIRETRLHITVLTATARIVPIGTEYEVISEGAENRCLVWEGSVRVEGQARKVEVSSNAQLELTADLDSPPYPLSKRRHLAESQNLTQSVSLPPETETHVITETPAPVEAPSLPAPAYPHFEATAAPPAPNVTATASDSPSPTPTPEPASQVGPPPGGPGGPGNGPGHPGDRPGGNSPFPGSKNQQPGGTNPGESRGPGGPGGTGGGPGGGPGGPGGPGGGGGHR